MCLRNFLIALSLLPLCAQAQLSLEQATLGQWRQFGPKDLMNVQWKDAGTLTCWDATGIQKIEPNGKRIELFGLEQLNRILGDSLKGFPFSYAWVNPNLLQLQQGLRIIQIDLSQQNRVLDYTLPEDAENIHPHLGSGKTAFTRGQNVWLAEKNGALRAITKDEKPGVVNGSGYVHRQEFGIAEGLFWSPDGSALAWYRKDESMVTEYPLVESSPRIAAQRPVRYPMAGMKSEEVSIQVLQLDGGSTQTLNTEGPKEQYLTAVTWSPDSKSMYVGLLNRGQDSLKLCRYRISDGRLEAELLQETDPHWVEPEHGLSFIPGNPQQFIWRSERDGYDHAYLYSTEGKLIRQLSTGPFPITDFHGVFGKEVWITRSENNGLDRQSYAINLNSGKYRLLTEGDGVHSIIPNPSGTAWVDKLSNPLLPNRIDWVDARSRQRLLDAPNPYSEQGFTLPRAEQITLTAADGKTAVNARIIYPGQFDPSKKYPVLIYVYGGPHAQMISRSWLWGARLWDYYMAQEGYLVFTLDNRGSAHRGKIFEEVIHRQLGEMEATDQLQGLNYLKSLPFVDKFRIGVHGWSFGGFMTTNLLTRNPDDFAVGVAGGPVMDWSLYEVMYGERYMDQPQENPEGYALSNLPARAKNLKAPLLIIHGDQDDVVVPQHSMQFIKACVDKSIPVDFFLYPNHAHNVAGKDRVHLMDKITRYLNQHLKP
ncbi:MAG: DPP IV N-terminal domain-containing protein [Bacteroidetes bacterium]|nr:DPP IV N-terminal domain-containing protein [Bacteroidota bacterium]